MEGAPGLPGLPEALPRADVVFLAESARLEEEEASKAKTSPRGGSEASVERTERTARGDDDAADVMNAGDANGGPGRKKSTGARLPITASAGPSCAADALFDREGFLPEQYTRADFLGHHNGAIDSSCKSTNDPTGGCRYLPKLPRGVRRNLESVPASGMACKIDILDIRLDQSIAEVLATLEAENLTFARYSEDVSDANNDPIFSRMSLVQAAMQSDDLRLPLSSVINSAVRCECVGDDETLLDVLAIMLSTGKDEVVVRDEQFVTGVITIRQILATLRRSEPSPKVHPGQSGRRVSLVSQDGCVLGPFGDFQHPLQVPVHFENSNSDSDNIEIHTKEESRKKRYAHFSKAQLAAQEFCTTWCGELLIALCVALDISIGIADFASNGQVGHDSRGLTLTCCMLAVYIYERALRTYGFGTEMLRHPLWMVDCMVVDVSAIVTILILAEALSTASSSTETLLRTLRMMRILLIVRNLNLTTKIRQAVSSQKARYREGGFDLDLTYVNKACIAMSLPAVGTEASYRNPVSEVQRFFATNHPDHFLIFNLCKERSYEKELFDGRVWKIDVEDHNPPLLSQMVEFLEVARKFMEADPINCIAVHCKGGKGRSGTMICAWLMYSRFEATAQDAMEWFATVRTGEKARAIQGVSQPSQQRYVVYIQQAIELGGYYSPRLTLKKIIMRTCPHVDNDGGCNPWFTIEENGKPIFDYRNHQTDYLHMGKDEFLQMNKDDPDITFDIDVPLEGDVRIIFFDHDDAYEASECCGLTKRKYAAAEDLCFFFWFHTGYITSKNWIMKKEEIDMACHDAKCKVFEKEFELELEFDRVAPGPSAHPSDRGSFCKIIPPSEDLIQRTKAMKILNQYFRAPAAAAGTPRPDSFTSSRKWNASPSVQRHSSVWSDQTTDKA